MKKNVKRGIAMMLLMTSILVGGYSMTAKAIDPPDIDPLSLPIPPTEQM